MSLTLDPYSLFLTEPDRFLQAIPSAVTKATVPTMGALFARTPCLLRQPTAPIWAQIHLAIGSVGLSVVLTTVRVAQAIHLLVIWGGTDAPVTAAANVLATSSASNKTSTVAKLASASSCQANVLITTILYAAVITKRMITHVWLPFKGGRPSSIMANVAVTGIRAIVTVVVKAMSSATFHSQIVETAGMGENACPFLLDRTVQAFQMIKYAVVIMSSTRIHAKPIKAGRVFRIWATVPMRILLLSESVTSILPGA
jgi:hypothetical protein